MTTLILAPRTFETMGSEAKDCSKPMPGLLGKVGFRSAMEDMLGLPEGLKSNNKKKKKKKNMKDKHKKHKEQQRNGQQQTICFNDLGSTCCY